MALPKVESAFTANLLAKATKTSCWISNVSLLVLFFFYNKVLTVSEIWSNHVPGCLRISKYNQAYTQERRTLATVLTTGTSEFSFSTDAI